MPNALSPAPTPFDDQVLLDYFEAVRSAFDRAADSGELHERHYRIGPHIACLRAVGHRVAERMTAAIEHLRVEAVTNPDVTLGLWDRKSSSPQGTPPSPWGWLAKHRGRGQTPALRFNSHGELTEFRSERIYTGFRLSPHKLRVLDVQRGIGFYWTDDIETIPDYEYCAPLRKMMAWWLSALGHQIVHAAAVGTAEGGVLLAGKGGSGKSTSALACLGSGLLYAGDDCCVLDRGDPYVHSLYNSAKLKTLADVARFPHLSAAVQNVERGAGEKAYMFLQRWNPQVLSPGFPIRALLIPRVTGCAAPAIRPASPAAGLAALAPTTLSLFPGLEQVASRRMARLVSQVPSYVMEVGPDITGIPPAIRALLEKA